MFVRLGLLHYCPVFAGTKLTNPILCETEKRKNAKTLGVTRFQKPAVQKDVRFLGFESFLLRKKVKKSFKVLSTGL